MQYNECAFKKNAGMSIVTAAASNIAGMSIVLAATSESSTDTPTPANASQSTISAPASFLAAILVAILYPSSVSSASADAPVTYHVLFATAASTF